MASTGKGALLTDQHRRRQVSLAITADSQARRAWDATLDLNDLTGTQPIWKRTMLNLIQTWWRISEQAALAYLPQYREAETGEGPGIEIGVQQFDRRRAGEKLDWLGSTNVKWHLASGDTPEDAYRKARELFLGVFHEAVLTGGRSAIEHWAQQDTRAIGWRRVSDGDPCAFCAMLVTRGPVYTNAKKAGLRASDGKKYHPHCGCTVEVVYGDWEPTQQEQQWIDEYYKAAESLPERTPRTAQDILPIMRRNGAFRDSRSIRGTKTALAARRAERYDRKIAGLRGKTLNHILRGEGDGRRGGHLYGTGVAGKTEFPRQLDERRIATAINRTIETPDWHIDAPDSRALHRFGKTIDGVQIEVKAYLQDGEYVIDRAYPVGGEGVTRNTENGRIDVKASRSKKWRQP